MTLSAMPRPPIKNKSSYAGYPIRIQILEPMEINSCKKISA